MEEYASNSHKSKTAAVVEEPQKKVEKVIEGTAKTRKRSTFAETFIAEDTRTVKSYLLNDIFVPALKKFISDAITSAVEMFLYGEKKSSNNRPASQVSYRSYYNKDDRSRYQAPTRSRYNYDDVVLDTRGEAEQVLTCMDEMLATYGVCSVADFYDLCGITGAYTDNNYGWTDLRSAAIQRTRDGYIIKLPRACPID